MKLRVPGPQVDKRKLGGDCGKDCPAFKLKREDGMDRNRWRKQMNMREQINGNVD